MIEEYNITIQMYKYFLIKTKMVNDRRPQWFHQANIMCKHGFRQYLPGTPDFYRIVLCFMNFRWCYTLTESSQKIDFCIDEKT